MLIKIAPHAVYLVLVRLFTPSWLLLCRWSVGLQKMYTASWGYVGHNLWACWTFSKVVFAMGPELPFLGGRVVGAWPPAQIRHVGFRWQSGNQRTGSTLLSGWWWRKHGELLFTRLLSRPLYMIFFVHVLYIFSLLISQTKRFLFPSFQLSLDDFRVATTAADFSLS